MQGVRASSLGVSTARTHIALLAQYLSIPEFMMGRSFIKTSFSQLFINSELLSDIADQLLMDT
jgi:hypothetical protein